MLTRKKFLQLTTLSAPMLTSLKSFALDTQPVNKPIVVCTWAPNVKANAEAWKTLGIGGKALDAVEAGVKIPEADPDDHSVGYGGLPDRDGKVTLDACIMDENANIGSVMALENIMHAISVARLVMEKTPHVQLAGDGALQFALANGFTKMNLLTPDSERIWKEWLKTSGYVPNTSMKKVDYTWPVAVLNHDTI